MGLKVPRQKGKRLSFISVPPKDRGEYMRDPVAYRDRMTTTHGGNKEDEQRSEQQTTA